MKLCDYGCGQEATHQFKNGKFCCCNHNKKCPTYKNMLIGVPSKKTGKKYKIKVIKNNPGICEYGCGKESKFYFKEVKKWCCSKSTNSCEEVRRKKSESATGYIHTEESKQKMRKPHSDEHKKNSSISHKGQESGMKGKQHSNESKLKMSKSLTGRKISEKNKQILREKCLNGYSVKMIKCIKRISKPEIKLRELVKEIYKNCIFQEKVLNYAIDVAILEYKIAIEYDGYYHFNCQENIDYQNMRQKRIENEGWKFLRYNKIPKIEELKENIFKMIGENKNE